MKIRQLITLLALSSLVLSACAVLRPASRQTISGGEPAIGAFPAEAPAAFDDLAGEPALETFAEEGRAFVDTDLPQERLVIRNASLTLVVEDPADTVTELSRMATEMGGFVVSSNVFQSTFGEARLVANQASITIRVPSERLDEALERMKAGAVEVRNENVSGQDVTQEFTDLQSRLTNLEAAEEQLRLIMDDAVKTEDVLRVFEDLRRVREEIEVIKGRIQYLEQSARLSAISAELIPDVAAQPIQIGGWSPTGVAKDAIEALVRTLQSLASAAIWLGIYILPVAALLLALPLLIVRWYVLRRRGQARPESGEASGA